jgi:hypothetical protein
VLAWVPVDGLVVTGGFVVAGLVGRVLDGDGVVDGVARVVGGVVLCVGSLGDVVGVDVVVGGDEVRRVARWEG